LQVPAVAWLLLPIKDVVVAPELVLVSPKILAGKLPWLLFAFPTRNAKPQLLELDPIIIE
jgi:hypothetical protein